MVVRLARIGLLRGQMSMESMTQLEPINIQVMRCVQVLVVLPLPILSMLILDIGYGSDLQNIGVTFASNGTRQEEKQAVRLAIQLKHRLLFRHMVSEPLVTQTNSYFANIRNVAGDRNVRSCFDIGNVNYKGHQNGVYANTDNGDTTTYYWYCNNLYGSVAGFGFQFDVSSATQENRSSGVY